MQPAHAEGGHASTHGNIELFGVPLTGFPRPGGPLRTCEPTAAARLDALERECDRMLRNVMVGVVLVALGVAFWIGGSASVARADGGARVESDS